MNDTPVPTPTHSVHDSKTGEVWQESSFPDGIGMSIENVRALLAKEHETVIPKDDPVLLIVTILNAFLSEEEKLFDRHTKALTRIMGDKTDSYIREVQQSIEALRQGIAKSSVDGIRKAFDAHTASFTAFQNTIKWLTAIIGVSALVNVAVFVLRAVQ